MTDNNESLTPLLGEYKLVDDRPYIEPELINKLFGNIVFKLSAPSEQFLPPEDRLEVCFAGRSNVGKSTLINSISNQKQLARASTEPGRTQEINYFDAADTFYLVDLPGYGFAKAPKKIVVAWNKFVKNYFSTRKYLKRIYILIDSRHGVKQIDKDIFTLLDKVGVSYQIILTKTDKIKENELKKVINDTHNILNKFVAGHPRVLTSSSITHTGIDEIKKEITELLVTTFNSGK